MTLDELREEIQVQLEYMELTVKELVALMNEVQQREASNREKMAAAGFLAQFYNGVENILKRISIYHDTPLPSGEMWHLELFERFQEPSFGSLPLLFNNELGEWLAPYRKFRHVVFHGYGFQFDWSRMLDGMRNIEEVFETFSKSVSHYLSSLKNTK